MIVTEIEVHEVECMHHEWIRDTLDHYFEESKRFIFIAHTDTGLTGLGEASSDQSEVIDQYIGTNPFQWIGDSTSLGLGTAMYDLMGKAVGVPVWQLVGPQQRGYVPVGSWTVSAEPAHMAEAVQRYAARGYTWMKYHLSPFQNVIDQVEAIAAVAPPGSKLHLDFTMEPWRATPTSASGSPSMIVSACLRIPSPLRTLWLTKSSRPEQGGLWCFITRRWDSPQRSSWTCAYLHRCTPLNAKSFRTLNC